MSISYFNQPVIDLVRQLVAAQLEADGDTVLVIPDDYAAQSYSNQEFSYPLTVVKVDKQADETGKPAVFDISHWLQLSIFHVRTRAGADFLEDDVAAERINTVAAYFGNNRRLGGNVQQILVKARATGEEAAMGVNFIPIEQLSGLAVASINVEICWIENLIAS